MSSVINLTAMGLAPMVTIEIWTRNPNGGTAIRSTTSGDVWGSTCCGRLWDRKQWALTCDLPSRSHRDYLIDRYTRNNGDGSFTELTFRRDSIGLANGRMPVGGFKEGWERYGLVDIRPSIPTVNGVGIDEIANEEPVTPAEVPLGTSLLGTAKTDNAFWNR